MLLPSKMKSFTVALCIILYICVVYSACPNGCSSRGLCVNNVCQCNQGLSGADCSVVNTPGISIAACPSCYTITIGPAEYYSGPSWRLPDGPIVGLNYQGNLSMYQANGDTFQVATGTSPDNFNLAPVTSLPAGPDSTKFDYCGAWMMRAFTNAGGAINGFYHAEYSCDYSNNGQTHKSAAWAQSFDGGKTFTKPNYPNNRIIDSNAQPGIGYSTGEGDIGVVQWRGYYYLYFQSAQDSSLGVARAPVSSQGAPGNWYKYFNNAWNEPGLGGQHTPIYSLPGTQVYAHTPTDTLVSVGGNYVWGRGGAILSVSLDGVTWTYLGDPLILADPNSFGGANGAELITYLSAMGINGGYDIGDSFYLYYMWAEPWRGYSARYQLRRLVTLQKVDTATSVNVGKTIPQSRLALVTYVNKQTGERWDTREYCRQPYSPTRILGYLMTRSYPSTKQVFDCWQYGPGDHFVSFYEECLANGFNNMRPLGYMWTTRQPNSVSVYRCVRTTPILDTFLTDDINCEGLAPPQTTPFGWLITGPALSDSLRSKDTLVGQGAGGWMYIGQWGNVLPPVWSSITYDDSHWSQGLAPFTDSYNLGASTFFGRSSYYFRYHFTVPNGKTVSSVLISTASDDNSQVFLNGVLVDDEGVGSHHEAAYWNRKISAPASLLKLNGADNVLAVLVRNSDEWAMFDAQLDVTYTQPNPNPGPVCNNNCVQYNHGNCGWKGTCVCDALWTGPQCGMPICYASGQQKNVVVFDRGTAGWLYSSTVDPAATLLWNSMNYNEYGWSTGAAPFGLGYTKTVYPYFAVNTTVPNSGYLYRRHFTINIPTGNRIISATASIASDDFHVAFINGANIDGTVSPYNAHQAAYWNNVVSVDPGLLVNGDNIVAVQVFNWPTSNMLYFDMKLEIVLQLYVCPQSKRDEPEGGEAETPEVSETENPEVPETENLEVPPETQQEENPNSVKNDEQSRPLPILPSIGDTMVSSSSGFGQAHKNSDGSGGFLEPTPGDLTSSTSTTFVPNYLSNQTTSTSTTESALSKATSIRSSFAILALAFLFFFVLP
eukprot:TRINITY_DN243_c0_g1_i1.p1 TRINITY_DN243_c0_g1~~TRINITY_DN243_c0_g1_i1.p1  ORF type:complete len:1053 (+),score=192.49 TRINITY_DN243_c0_g1_i1:505-3663(+)